MSLAERYPQISEDIEELKKVVISQYNEIEKWKEAHNRQKEAYEEKVEEYQVLEEKYRILRHTIFGRSSEKRIIEDKSQGRLFNEAELAVDEEASGEEEKLEEIRSYKRKVRGKRKPIPAEIPREEVVHDIGEEEKICGCGERLVRIGEETSEKLEIIPAQVKVIRHVRPKYACRVCEGSGDEERSAVRIAPPVKELLPKSIASAGLVAHIISGKYCDALPLYRQERMFKRIGVDISRASMARWIIELGSKISPLLEEMDKRILEGTLVQMDETRIQVHKEAGRDNHKQSYMWVVRGGPPEAPLVRYMYHPSRSGEIARSYLAGYEGHLQTDGYEAYNRIGEKEGIVHVGCLAHARRKFDEASKVTGGSPASREFLSLIGQIYRVEKELRSNESLSKEEFLQQRRERAGPFLEKLKKKLEEKEQRVAPSTALGRAVNYTLEVLPRIVRYLDLHCLTPDNNVCERAIRPFVIGRKNWLFADTPRGAHASAAFYSLIETAKSASLEPYWYIRYLLQKLPDVEKTGKWESLLPENLTQEMLLTPSC